MVARPVGALFVDAEGGHGVGRVHSVFSGVVNLMLADGTIVAFQDAAVPKTPMSVVVSPFPAGDDREVASAFRVGSELRTVGRDFCIGNWCWTFDSGAVGVWEPSFVPERDLSADSVAVVRSTVVSVLDSRPSADGFEFMAGSPARSDDASAEPTLRFLHAWRQLLRSDAVRVDPRLREAFLEQIGRLLGLGPGLTPSGDDFVIGWLASSTLMRSRTQRLVAILAPAVEQLAEARTNALSAQFLRHALHAEWSEPLGDFLRACSASRPALEEATRAVAGIGSTSGLDMLRGFLTGLDAASPPGP